MRVKQFVLGDVFSVRHVQKLTLPGKAYVMDKEIISDDGEYPYVAAISRNNGISGYSHFAPNNKGDCVTLSTTADSSNTVFYQADDFIGRQQIAEIRRKDGKPLGLHCGLYVATVVRNLTRQFNYANKLTVDYLRACNVALPSVTVMMPDWAMLETLLKVHGGGAGMSKIDTSSWKKFKISDLFGKAKLGKYHNPETLTADPKGYEYICASNLNNGVNKDLPRVTGDNLSLTAPNIIAWGKQCPMFTWHKDACVTSQGMYYIELGKLSEQCALFIITLLEHVCKGQYGYNNCLIGSKFDEIEISLPVTAVEQPDWDYMQERIAELEQERIAELEQERIAELEQYLVATGLNDYTLTDEDLKTLSLSGFRGDETENLPAVAGLRKEMRAFKMGTIFEKKELKWRPDRTFDKSKDTSQVPTSEFSLPLVNAKHGDNGIMFYGRPDEWDSTDMAIDIVSNGAIATGDVYPQPQNTGVLWDAYLIKLVDGKVSAEVLMYFAAVIEKSIKLLYSYDNKAVWNKVQHDVIELPIQTDVTGRPIIDPAKMYHTDGFVPDWDYMEAYIRVIEKLVIKDVVDFKDAFISKAKLVVARC